MGAILQRILICLVYTEASELAVAALLRVRTKKDFLVIGLINLATNPLVTYALTLIPFLGIYPYSMWILMGLEVFAVVTEGMVYRYSGMKKPFLLSLVLNAVSYFSGLLIRLWMF